MAYLSSIIELWCADVSRLCSQTREAVVRRDQPGQCRTGAAAVRAAIRAYLRRRARPWWIATQTFINAGVVCAALSAIARHSLRCPTHLGQRRAVEYDRRRRMG